jgi:hypothetical protein
MNFLQFLSKDISQEENSVFLEQSNELRVTATPCTSKFQCPADPGNWPDVIRVDDSFRIAAVKLGPLDISKQNLRFPADKES